MDNMAVRRFPSFGFNKTETRRTLRERLWRYIHVAKQAVLTHAKVGTPMLSDEAALALLSSIEIRFGSDEQAAFSRFNEIAAISGETNWSELMDKGWLRVALGRVAVSDGARKHVENAAEFAPALAQLVKTIYTQSYSFASEPSAPDLQDVVQKLADGTLSEITIGCRSPQWVALRLWDRKYTNAEPSAEALRAWLDRWRILGAPMITAHLDWAETDSERFVQSCLSYLETDVPIQGWQRRRAAVLALSSPSMAETVDRLVPPLPDGAIERVLWTEIPYVDQHSSSEFNEDIPGIVQLLISDVQAIEYSPLPQPIVSRIVELGVERPDIFESFIFQCDQHPKILADLLLDGSTCALASFLIARHALTSGAWDRPLQANDARDNLTKAFSDAVAILGGHLQLGAADSVDVATLVRWLHTDIPNQRLLGDRTAMLNLLRTVLAQLDTTVILIINEHLFASPFQEGLGSPAFDAVIDLVGATNLATLPDGEDCIRTYVQALHRSDYAITAKRINAASADVLLQLVETSRENVAKSFYYPFAETIRIAEADSDNEFTTQEQVARAIRAHTRVLCRAAPAHAFDKLLQSLISAIRTGAKSQPDNKLYGAFAVKFSSFPSQDVDREIALDLADALKAFQCANRDQLLNAILEIDEPYTLSLLSMSAPRSVRDRIIERVRELTPDNAATVYRITDIQLRINALLSAQITEVASAYMALEAELKTAGPQLDRVHAAFIADLRLKLLNKRWEELEAAKLPEDLDQRDVDKANESLYFFKGLTALLKPEPDYQRAIAIFDRLTTAHPETFAYHVNLLASNAAALLKGGLFGKISPEDAERARTLLDEASRAQYTALSEEQNGFDSNRALLMLGLGRVEATSELLSSRAEKLVSREIVACAAVASSRLGRSSKGLAMIDEAIEAFGDSDYLKAARQDILKDGKTVAVPFTVGLPDHMVRIKVAMFELLSLNPEEQAIVLDSDGGFQGLLTYYIRSAAASLIDLTPWLGNLGLPEAEASLNVMFKHMISGYISFLKWSISDESMGGFSARGKPGRRDFVIASGSSSLAVVEAVVCRESVGLKKTRDDLLKHFRKLFGYTTCALRFYVTYVVGEEIDAVTSALEKIAEANAPAGFTYTGMRDLPISGSQPNGFVAKYNHSASDVTMVFLTLDLRQDAQRRAATIAAT